MSFQNVLKCWPRMLTHTHSVANLKVNNACGCRCSTHSPKHPYSQNFIYGNIKHQEISPKITGQKILRVISCNFLVATLMPPTPCQKSQEASSHAPNSQCWNFHRHIDWQVLQVPHGPHGPHAANLVADLMLV